MKFLRVGDTFINVDNVVTFDVELSKDGDKIYLIYKDCGGTDHTKAFWREWYMYQSLSVGLVENALRKALAAEAVVVDIADYFDKEASI